MDNPVNEVFRAVESVTAPDWEAATQLVSNLQDKLQAVVDKNSDFTARNVLAQLKHQVDNGDIEMWRIVEVDSTTRKVLGSRDFISGGLNGDEQRLVAESGDGKSVSVYGVRVNESGDLMTLLDADSRNIDPSSKRENFNPSWEVKEGAAFSARGSSIVQRDENVTLVIKHFSIQDQPKTMV